MSNTISSNSNKTTQKLIEYKKETENHINLLREENKNIQKQLEQIAKNTADKLDKTKNEIINNLLSNQKEVNIENQKYQKKINYLMIFSIIMFLSVISLVIINLIQA